MSVFDTQNNVRHRHYGLIVRDCHLLGVGICVLILNKPLKGIWVGSVAERFVTLFTTSDVESRKKCGFIQLL